MLSALRLQTSAQHQSHFPLKTFRSAIDAVAVELSLRPGRLHVSQMDVLGGQDFALPADVLVSLMKFHSYRSPFFTRTHLIGSGRTGHGSLPQQTQGHSRRYVQVVFTAISLDRSVDTGRIMGWKSGVRFLESDIHV
jgi:hypothetical protein